MFLCLLNGMCSSVVLFVRLKLVEMYFLVIEPPSTLPIQPAIRSL